MQNLPVRLAGREDAANLAELPDELRLAMANVASSAREGLLAMSVAVGLRVLGELMDAELATKVGAKGRHDPARTASRHGTAPGSVVSVWALYLRPTGPVLNLSFGALSNRSFDQALALLNDLKAEPALGAALADIDETTLNKYPPVPIDGLLTTPAVQESGFAALDRLTMTNADERP